MDIEHIEELEVDLAGIGPRGYSAYELAKLHGFEGTEEEYLLSLHGEQGPQGEQGETGPVGPQGVSGVYIGPEEPDDDDYNVWIDTDEYDEPLDLSGYALKTEIPTKLSELTNDINAASVEDIPTKLSQLENDANMVTSLDISSIRVVTEYPEVMEENVLYLLKEE